MGWPAGSHHLVVEDHDITYTVTLLLAETVVSIVFPKFSFGDMHTDVRIGSECTENQIPFVRRF